MSVIKVGQSLVGVAQQIRIEPSQYGNHLIHFARLRTRLMVLEDPGSPVAMSVLFRLSHLKNCLHHESERLG